MHRVVGAAFCYGVGAAICYGVGQYECFVPGGGSPGGSRPAPRGGAGKVRPSPPPVKGCARVSNPNPSCNNPKHECC
eukprot:386330-Rhodomonas_salina.1